MQMYLSVTETARGAGERRAISNIAGQHRATTCQHMSTVATEQQRSEN